MPQVVEVGKYVHEIEEGNNLVAVGVDVSVQEEKYQEIYGVLRNKFDVLLDELRKLRVTQPNLTNIIITMTKNKQIRLNIHIGISTESITQLRLLSRCVYVIC